jgi:hypothetical protein
VGGRLSFGCTSFSFGAGKGFLGGNEEMDVVQVIALGWVHGLHLLLTGFLCMRYRGGPKRVCSIQKAAAKWAAVANRFEDSRPNQADAPP